MMWYRKPTDMVIVKLVDTNVKILGSKEEFRRQLGMDADLAQRDRNAPTSLLIECGENWCKDGAAALTLTTAFIGQIRDIANARAQETARQMQKPDSSPADLQSDIEHKHFTSTLVKLADMFEKAEMRCHSPASRSEQEEQANFLPTFDRLRIEANSTTQSDSESDSSSEPNSPKGKERPLPGFFTQSRRAKAKKAKVATLAPADGQAKEVTLTSLAAYFKKTSDQEAAALGSVDHSHQPATLVTDALIINFTYHSLEKTTERFEFEHDQNALISKDSQNEETVVVDILCHAQAHYEAKESAADDVKHLELAARTRVPVVTKLLEFRTGLSNALDPQHFQDSSKIPSFGEPLRLSNGTLRTLQTTTGTSYDAYVFAYMAIATVILLREYDRLKCAIEAEAIDCFSVVDRLTASISGRAVEPTVSVFNNHSVAIYLLLKIIITRAQRRNDHRCTFSEFIQYYQFEDLTAGTARLVPAAVKYRLTEAARLIKEVTEDRTRTRYEKTRPGQPLPPVMFHINNNPVLCGLNMFEIIFRVRVETAKLEKKDPILMTFLRLINMICQMWGLDKWEDAEAAIALLGVDKVFGPGARPTTWSQFHDRYNCSLDRIREYGYLEPSKLMEMMHEHTMIGTWETYHAI